MLNRLEASGCICVEVFREGKRKCEERRRVETGGRHGDDECDVDVMGLG
jgi:hypothetical protein